MGELENKHDDKKRAEKEERKKRAELDDDEKNEDEQEGINLIPWEADVNRFLELLELALRDFRMSMTGGEFRDLSARYHELTPTEKRSVGNRLQQRRLGNLHRALHAGDYRAYVEGWETEARAAAEAVAGPRPDSP